MIRFGAFLSTVLLVSIAGAPAFGLVFDVDPNIPRTAVRTTLSAYYIQRLSISHEGVSSLDVMLVREPHITFSEAVNVAGSQVSRMDFHHDSGTKEFLCRRFGFGAPRAVSGLSQSKPTPDTYLFFASSGSNQLSTYSSADARAIDTLICEVR